MKFRLSVFSILLILCLSLTPSGSLSASDSLAPEGLTITVEAGLGGSIKEGFWAPVLVTLENQGAAISGEVVIESGQTLLSGERVSHAIELPHQSRKQITLYTRSFNRFTSAFTISLLDESGRVLAAEDAPLRVISPTRFLIGVWSDDLGLPTTLSAIETPAGNAMVAPLSADLLPDQALAWRALDGLIVADVDTSVLSAAQQEALNGWVSGGGHLILIGGSRPDGVFSGLAAFSPVRVLRTDRVDLAPLADLAGQSLTTQETIATSSIGQLIEGAEALSESDSVPLVASQRWGGGRVSFIAADPSLEPLASWEGSPLLWRAILAQASPAPGWSFGFMGSDTYTASSAVQAIPGLGLPALGPLLLFLIVYLLVIGPLNYLLVSQLKKRELSWFTIPILVTIFSVAAYLVGFSLKSANVIVHRLAVIQTYPGSDAARMDGLLGVWSPRRRAYDISLESGTLPQRLDTSMGGAMISNSSGLSLSLDDSPLLQDEQIDASSLKSYILQGTVNDAPQVEGDLIAHFDLNKLFIEGEVVNYSPFDLQDVSILYLGHAVQLGDLAAGEVMTVSTALQTIEYQQLAMRSGLLPYPLQTDDYYYLQPGLQSILSGLSCDTWFEDIDRRRCDLLAALFTTADIDAEAYLFGWVDEPFYDVTVRDVEMSSIDQTLLIAELRSSFAALSADPITSLPEEFITWDLEEKSPSVYVLGPDGFYLDPGDQIGYRFSAALPAPAGFNSFTLSVTQYTMTLVQPAISVYNFETDHWVEMTLSPGGSITLEGEQFFAAGQAIRVRFANPEGAEYPIEVGEISVTFHRLSGN